MSTLVPILISWLQLYGYPALWIFVFLASAGAPLPLGLVLLATGAFAALGDFNIVILVVVTSSASICGDSFGYWLGRKIGPGLLDWLSQSPESRPEGRPGSQGKPLSWVTERATEADHRAQEPQQVQSTATARSVIQLSFKGKQLKGANGASMTEAKATGKSKKRRRLRFISPKVIERSQEYFQRHGAWAILLSRCVVPALGGTINILAGAERYPYRRFLLYDVIGEIIGAVLPLTLGYIFGVSWEAIGALLTTISLLIVALLVVFYLTFLLIRLLLTRIQIARRARRLSQAGSTTEIRYPTQEDELERQV